MEKRTPIVVLDDAPVGRLLVFGEPIRTIAAHTEDELPAAFAALTENPYRLARDIRGIAAWPWPQIQRSRTFGRRFAPARK